MQKYMDGCINARQYRKSKKYKTQRIFYSEDVWQEIFAQVAMKIA
jgi:hypothetical protein